MDNFPDPSIIGKAFVRQYYTQMHKDPCQMHRFYMSHSSFVHGGSDMGSEEPVIGQKNIHDKVLSLDLQQVHAKIKQVDAHSTLQGGIVVQVTGELSIKGHPMRAFVQTFVLAQQNEKSFYVHNDIFRYQDDDLVSESETNEAPVDPEPSLIETLETCEFQTENNVDGGFSNEAVPSTPTPTGPQEATSPTGWAQYDGTLGEVAQNGVDISTASPPQEFPSATEPAVEARQDEETFPSVTVETPEQDNKTASTWASRLAQKQQQSSSNRPLNSTAIPTSQALPQRDPRPRRTDNRPQTQQPSNSGNKDKKAPPTRDLPENSTQLFVGGLPPNTQDEELRKLFSSYGTVKDVRINPKNFAFVVFIESKAVSELIATKPPLDIRGKSINIEEKRAPRGGGGGGGGRMGGGGDRNRGGPGGVSGNKQQRGGGGAKNPKR